MHKFVVCQLFMCERLNPGTSPVLMSHWVAYEVLGSAQESFLMQVQVSSRCLHMCHSDLSAMPPVRVPTILPPLPLFQVPQNGTRNRTPWKGRCLHLKDFQQKVLGAEVGFKSFLSSWISTAVSPLL